MHVLIADHHPSVHDLLTAVLREAFAGVAIHSEKTLEGAMAKVRRAERLDLILLDLGLPGCRGIEALTRFRDKFPRCRVVVFSAMDDRALILSALRAGAAGYIPKGCSRKVMIAALRLVAAGGAYLPPEVLPQQIRVPVTTRQRDVLRL